LCHPAFRTPQLSVARLLGGVHWPSLVRDDFSIEFLRGLAQFRCVIS